MFMNNKNKNTSEESQNHKSQFYLDIQAIYFKKAKLLIIDQTTKIDNCIVEAAKWGQSSINRFFGSEYEGVVNRISDHYLSQGFETVITYLQSGEYRLTIQWEDQ